MAQYSRLIITKQGQELISRVLAGAESGVRFTRMCVSAAEYELSEAEGLTKLDDIRRTALVSHAERSDGSTIAVECSFTNETLGEGCYMRTIGLYAEGADGKEILYAVTVGESGGCYLPPYNGVTVSGAVVKLIAAVGNSESVSLETSSAAVATINDIKRLERAVTEVRETAAPTAFSVDTAAWTALTPPVVGRGYSAEIAAEGVSAGDFPDVYFDAASVEAASTASILADTADGAIVLYAKSIPTTALSGAYFIRKGVTE